MGNTKCSVRRTHQEHMKEMSPKKAAQSKVPADGMPLHHTLVNLRQMKAKQNGKTTDRRINEYLGDVHAYWHLWIALN